VNTIELCVNQSWVHASTSSPSSGTSVDARDDWYTIVPLAPILVSRFLLHLRQVSERGCDSDSDLDADTDARWWAEKDRSLPLRARSGEAGPAGSVAFSSRLVGNMGAGLVLASFAAEEDGENEWGDGGGEAGRGEYGRVSCESERSCASGSVAEGDGGACAR